MPRFTDKFEIGQRAVDFNRLDNHTGTVTESLPDGRVRIRWDSAGERATDGAIKVPTIREYSQADSIRLFQLDD